MAATSEITRSALHDKDSNLRVVELVRRYRWQAKLSELGFTTEHVEYIAHVLHVITACGSGQLGCHVFSCDGCGRTLTGFNRCGNRHCPGCSYQGRTQWHDCIVQWNLHCDYWHIVFTLPHESHPLIRGNLKFMYGLLFGCAADTLLGIIAKQFGCTPGLVMVLHSWGQRVKFHVHVHIILTGGGLSLDKGKQRWIEFPRDHRALQADGLSPVFQRCFLRRLKRAMRGSKLVWPERLLAGQTLPLADASAPPQKKRSLRALTADELDLLSVLRSKRWVVHVQPTEADQSGADGTVRPGAEGIANYLARYVSGTAIGNKRLIRDDGRYVTYWYTDYRTGEIKTETVSGGEFVQRISLHIMPRNMQRVRYKGLLAPAGRDKRLQQCRQLIAEANPSNTQARAAAGASSGDSIAGRLHEDQAEPDDKSSCTCRYCNGRLEVVGRLKGTETLRVKALAAGILSLLPVISAKDLQSLLDQLAGGLLHIWRLATPLQEVHTASLPTGVQSPGVDGAGRAATRISIIPARR